MLIERGYLSCPECGGVDLVTVGDLPEVSGGMAAGCRCRDCGHEWRVYAEFEMHAYGDIPKAVTVRRFPYEPGDPGDRIVVT